VRVCVCNAVRAAPFWQDRAYTAMAGARKKSATICFASCALASAPFAREDEVDQRRLMSPASHGRCTARTFTVVRHTYEALPWPHRSPVTATSGGYVRVHTARHRMQDLWLCVFQFAACYEAHLPSVTVRDENAGRPTYQARLQLSHSLTDKRWPAWDDDDAMHRDVCRQSERRNTVQRDQWTPAGNCSHIWRRNMLE
jgi:hypothetical protein